VQGEDEIASIGMCIGAAMTGARAMTATSGPGMSLYSENLGLAVMGEVPLVVVDVQRLGPATGAATTPAQGDIQFVRWGMPGGFPVIALAPADVADCYHLAVRAFALAERFRCPVFLLTDKELNLTMQTVDLPLRSALPPLGEAPPRIDPGGAVYRYDDPGAVPIMRPYGGAEPVRFTGSAHDEAAFLTKDPPTVGALNKHLIAKIARHRSALEIVARDHRAGAETLVVAYGITAGAAEEAVEIARRSGSEVSLLVPKTLWPVPVNAIADALAGVRRVVVAELNPGLYRREVERLSGEREVVGIHRLDGRLITPDEIAEALA
jgi:2-oxoglutarate ferredoxin oxidoreductase subunit alpha